MSRKKFSHPFLATTAFAAATVLPGAAQAQDQPIPADTVEAQTDMQSEPQAEEEYSEDELGEEEIVVVGGRLRGSVIGDIPPENTLDARDIRATGATDVDEILEAIEPQIGSARGRGGGRPVMLLNGQRISSFRELRDIPAEAIARVEILPEEVALKYGYRADQRVVNFVLRQRFRSTVARAEGSIPTEGGLAGGEVEATRLIIGERSRTTLDLEVEANGSLTEAERDIRLEPGGPDERAARTLTPSRRLVRGTATVNRQIGTVSATANLELEHNDGRSLLGLSDFALEPLARNVTSDTAHAGLSLNGNLDRWRWSGTGNADIARNVTESDRRDETLDDRTRSLNSSADIDLMLNGPLFSFPAGEATTTLRVGASTLHLDSKRRRNGISRSNDLGRTRGFASANFDLPVSRRNGEFSTLGNLTFNANGEIEQLSDFGTLLTIGAGMNWSPVERLNLIASWTREEGAPSIQQLGNPILETPETRIFDFTRGETVLVTALTGGNQTLLADQRNVMKLGGNWQPFEETDLRLRAEYVHSRLDDPVSSFPGPSPELEAAFPARFVRDGGGNLVSIDLRPVNFDSARRDTFRWGVDFSKSLESRRPSQAQIDRFRERRSAATGSTGPGEPRTSGPQAGNTGRGGGRGFGRFGGRRGGRLQLSFTHIINLIDEVTIRSGIPELDYLEGDAVGSTGGRPRHELQARAGWSNNGLGARLSANWRSGSRVDSAIGDDLRFSPLATFDLRLFANLGQQFGLVERHPFLRGSSVRLEIDNLFDAKPRVRDAFGDVPIGYQPDLLDPLGRTISISFRKLFLPPRGFFRRSQ